MSLDIKTKDVSVWLVKFPPFLVRLFSEMEKDGEIGTIEIVKPNSNDNSTAQLKLQINGCNVDFNVQWSEMKQIMYVLKGDVLEDGQNTDEYHQSNKKQEKPVDPLRLEGKISKEVVISPEFNEKYFAYKNNEAQKERREVSIIDHANKVRQERYTTVGEVDANARRRKKMLQQNKRERLDRSEVMDIIFRAFEIQKQWTVRDLADYSGQPNAYITEILQEIGELDKGDYRGTWTLKEEYQSKESEYL